MNQKEACNHTLGYTESNGYDGDTITDFIHMDFYELSDASKMKSNGCVFSFCPHCGENLEGLIEKRVKFLNDEIDKRKEEERVSREKREQAFQKEVDKVAIETKLDQLPDEGSFIVFFSPTKNSGGENVIKAGPKSLILRNCVHYNVNKSQKDVLNVEKIYKVFSQETFEEILKKNNWQPWAKTSFEKNENNVLKQISMDSAGIIYLTEKHTDSDGVLSPQYGQFYIHKLGKYLGIEIELETFELK